jgi:hypothetical protein
MDWKDTDASKAACMRAKPEIVKPEQAHRLGKLADCLIPEQTNVSSTS